jgi:hypothetical protein
VTTFFFPLFTPTSHQQRIPHSYLARDPEFSAPSTLRDHRPFRRHLATAISCSPRQPVRLAVRPREVSPRLDSLVPYTRQDTPSRVKTKKKPPGSLALSSRHLFLVLSLPFARGIDSDPFFLAGCLRLPTDRGLVYARVSVASTGTNELRKRKGKAVIIVKFRPERHPL